MGNTGGLGACDCAVAGDWSGTALEWFGVVWWFGVPQR